MRVLNDREYDLFERLAMLSQAELHKTLSTYLKGKYKKVIIQKEYIVAVGDIPIALVAHMDTVFFQSMTHMYYDQRKGVLWSPEGLGADDRAGIYMILQIIQSGLRPSIILTTDEERGGVGAQKLAKSECPIPFLKYMIQLDRHGANDCVFYDCYNTDFIDYIESFGFAEAIGSFSDISFLMPAWKICGVNLSVGYYDEHTTSETLNVNLMYRTLSIVKKMLEDTNNIPQFEYKEANSKLSDYYKIMSEYEAEYDLGTPCECCGKHFFDFELIPVKSKHKKKMVFYCPDCAVDKVDWCDECGHAYELKEEDGPLICPDCMEVLIVAGT